MCRYLREIGCATEINGCELWQGGANLNLLAIALAGGIQRLNVVSIAEAQCSEYPKACGSITRKSNLQPPDIGRSPRQIPAPDQLLSTY